jgi:hypothetical protein
VPPSWREGADGIRRAVQVVVNQVAPIRISHVKRGHPTLNRCIGDDDIDFAELLFDLVSDGAQEGDTPHICAHGLRAAAAMLPDQANSLVQFCGRCGLRI